MFKRPFDPDPKPTPPLLPSPPWELWDGKRAVEHWSICTGTAAVPAVHQGEQQAIGRCSNAPLTPTRNPHHRCSQARRGNCEMGRGQWGIGASVQAPPQSPQCIRESNRPSADVQTPL
jgi:hypothetical protein